RYLQRSALMMFNLPAYTRMLMSDFLAAGGRIEIEDFHTPADLVRVREKTLINATGYGARALFDDASVIPVRGQLARMIPQPQVEGHSDIVPELVGGLPVALADAEVEPPERRLAAHVSHGDAVLGGVAEREGHAHVTRHASERQLADGLIAARRLRELRGRVTRLRELRHREQVRAAQGVVALLVAGVGRAHLD